MKQIIPSKILLFCCFFYANSMAAVVNIAPLSGAVNSFDQSEAIHISLNKVDLEKNPGRRFKLKEKIKLKLFKQIIVNPKFGIKSMLEEKKKLKGGEKIVELAIVGLTFGLIGLFFVGIILGTLGLIFSIIALIKIRSNPEKKKIKVLAIAGIILGIAALVGALFTLQWMF